MHRITLVYLRACASFLKTIIICKDLILEEGTVLIEGGRRPPR
jgi:hypothetical protein